MEQHKQLLIVDSDGKRLDYIVRLTLWMNDKMSKEDETKCRVIFDRAMSELYEVFCDGRSDG